AEIAFEQRAHADVMIERVDFTQIVAGRRLSAFEPVRIDVQRQSVQVLIRLERHVPERKQKRRNQRHDRNQGQQPTPERQRQLEKCVRLVKPGFHHDSLPNRAILSVDVLRWILRSCHITSLVYRYFALAITPPPPLTSRYPCIS